MSEASEIEAVAAVADALAALSLNLTARQWEGLAAAQQRRLFAIYDLAEGITSKRLVTDDVAKEAAAIRDLCKLPHATLIKSGLLK